MNRLLFILTLCILSVFIGCKRPHPPQPPKQIPQVSIQQKAAHLLVYRGETSNDELGACTSTVVGPHALLTAEHCDIGTGHDNVIGLDLSTNEFHIKRRFRDGRDHIIYILDGAPFHDISVIHERPAKEGEYIYYYGDPNGSYPPVFRSGRVKHNKDASEIDRKEGIQYYTLESEPGCSGSAIYAKDGSIIGLITYGDVKFVGGKAIRNSIGFELNFSKKVLAQISK